MTFQKLMLKSSERMDGIRDGGVQLTVTSPPYITMRAEKEGKDISNFDYYEYLGTMQRIFRECYRVTAPGRLICVNISDYMIGGVNYPVMYHFYNLLETVGFSYHDTVIWRKSIGLSQSGPGAFMQNPKAMTVRHANAYEIIIVMSKGKAKKAKEITNINTKDKKHELALHDMKPFLTDVWDFNPVTSATKGWAYHKAMYPELLPELCIKFWSFIGEVILDPFLGSGTTMKVAKDLGRSCYGFELRGGELEETIKDKVGWGQQSITLGKIEYEVVE